MDRRRFSLTEHGQRLFEPNTFRMIRDLWKVAPTDCRAELLYEFIFEPQALRNRWREEERFRENMNKAWRD